MWEQQKAQVDVYSLVQRNQTRLTRDRDGPTMPRVRDTITTAL